MSDWIFITGGAQRIGKAIAEHFHRNNWNVIIHYRNSEKEANELKQKLNSIRKNSFEILKADLDDNASVQVLCKKVLEISPNLKAIINNEMSVKTIQSFGQSLS